MIPPYTHAHIHTVVTDAELKKARNKHDFSAVHDIN